MAPAAKKAAVVPVVAKKHSLQEILVEDFQLAKHHLGDFWHSLEHDVHDAVEALIHAKEHKKAVAEEARLAGGKKPAKSGPRLVLHVEKAWPPTAWPRAVRLLISGAMSGAVSKTATAPIETVRLNVMVGGKATGGSVPEVCAYLMKSQGLAGFFKGNMMNVVRTIPSKSIQFAAFDFYKKALSKPNPETGKLEASGLATTVAGSLSGITSTVACHPLEMIQTRLACSPAGAQLTIPLGAYKGVFDMVVRVVQKEGPKALFGGLGPSLVGIIPFAGTQFFVYDGLRWTYQQTTKQQTVPKTVALFAGSIAGVTAATVSFPLEVVRRRAMMGAKYKNSLEALMVISQKEGVGALFSGCTLNWVKVIPSTGIQLWTYEFTKELLQVDRPLAAAAKPEEKSGKAAAGAKK